jgi:MFS family permease
MMGSVGRLVVMRNTDNRNMLAAVALMVWPALAAPIIGPALGGLIVTHASWPWIFYVNVPIGIVGLALIIAYISKERVGERQPFDGVGFVLSSGAMICLVAGLESIAHSRNFLGPGLLLAAGVGLGVIAYRRFAMAAHPLIPLDALKVQTFATASIWGGWTFRMTVMATPFVLPLMFQVAFGFSPVRSGLLLLGYFAGNLAMKPFTNAVLRRFGFRQTLIVNIVICTATIAGFALFTAQTPDWIILAMAAASGASRSMQFTCLDSLTYCEIPPSMRTGATTLWGVTNQLAAVMGVAFAAIVLNLSRTLRHGDALTAVDFRITIAGLTLLCIMALPAFLALPKDAGADVTGHRAYARA